MAEPGTRQYGSVQLSEDHAHSVEEDYIGFLIFFACVLAALGVGLALRLVQQLRGQGAWLQHDRRWTQNSGAWL